MYHLNDVFDLHNCHEHTSKYLRTIECQGEGKSKKEKLHRLTVIFVTDRQTNRKS